MTFRVAFPALVVAAALALAFGEGSAKAAAPSVGISSPSTVWSGQFYAAPVIDPTLCLAGSLDPLNLTCDHFSLDVAAPGTQQVGISWADPANDFDLRVYDPTGGLVAESNVDGTRSESVTFPVTAGRYEVRVVPFFVIASGYQGTSSWSSAPSFRKKEILKARMDGGGRPFPSFADEARFEMDVHVITTSNGQFVRGKIRYREGKVFLRSVAIADAVPEPHGTGSTGGSFTVNGTASCNGQSNADFSLQANDNGRGIVDDFVLNSVACGFDSGPRNIAEGDLRFRQETGS